MSQIADWEYSLTRKLLKTAQQFVPLPGMPPLPDSPAAMPPGNPAWQAVLFQELLRLAKEHPDAVASAVDQTAYLFNPSADPRKLSEEIRADLKKRWRQLDPEKTPVFFYYPQTFSLNLPGVARELTAAEQAIRDWSSQHPSAYRYPKSVFPEMMTSLANPNIGGATYSWPQIRAPSGKDPLSTVIVMRGLPPLFAQILTHEYGHGLTPPVWGSSKSPPSALAGEAVAMSTIMTLLPRLAAMRHREPNTPVEAMLTGVDFDKMRKHTESYLQELEMTAKLFGVKGDMKPIASAVMQPSDVPLPLSDPWWQTMDYARSQVRRPRFIGPPVIVNDPTLQAADELTRALAYVVAYDQLKQTVPDVSKATYADLLRVLHDMSKSPKTRPLFDLVYYGPDSPEKIHEIISPILEKHPELKDTQFAKRILELSADPKIFQYIQRAAEKKQPVTTEPTAKKPSETKEIQQQRQQPSNTDKAPGKKDEAASSNSKDVKPSEKGK